jgi:hypothetical protein
MNIFEHFLNKISHKFPKGYPDMNDGQDISLLESLVSEILGEEIKLNEADTGGATLFESALVKAWYEINRKKMPEDAIPSADANKLDDDPDMVSKAKKIIKDLGLQGGKSARQTGRGAGSTTSFWKKFGATDATPKTDIILGDKRISVKVGSSQLMSGGVAESTATFYAAMEATPELLNSPEAKAVLNTFNDFVKAGYTKSGGVEANLKANKDKILTAADKAHKIMKSQLQALFDESESFKIAFAREAMSGYQKFGVDSDASADYILSTDSSLTKGSIHSVNDDSYVSKIANQMNLTVRFKSTSEKLKGEKTGRYRFWSVVSLIVNPSKNLDENIFTDTIKTVKNVLQTGINKIVNFLFPPEDIEVNVEDKINFDV